MTYSDVDADDDNDTGVEAFLRAIEEQARRRERDRNNDNDAMDEDWETSALTFTVHYVNKEYEKDS